MRRFTSSRFEPPKAGGGQLPYWFEESLLAFIREGHLIRLHREGMLSTTTLQSPYFEGVMAAIRPGQPWKGLAWETVPILVC